MKPGKWACNVTLANAHTIHAEERGAESQLLCLALKQAWYRIMGYAILWSEPAAVDVILVQPIEKAIEKRGKS